MPEYEPEDRHFESARLRLHYVVWGDESKPPLVLQHGGRDHARSWDFVATALIDRYCVYCPDLRGHGDSVTPRLQQAASIAAALKLAAAA